MSEMFKDHLLLAFVGIKPDNNDNQRTLRCHQNVPGVWLFLHVFGCKLMNRKKDGPRSGILEVASSRAFLAVSLVLLPICPFSSFFTCTKMRAQVSSP